MKIKVSKHKLNTHYRGSPRGSRTQQHTYCLRYAHSQHIEYFLGKKQQQAKIPMAFLFSQLHFINITSHALFYDGHLLMRNKRCAVQNQGITLSNEDGDGKEDGKIAIGLDRQNNNFARAWRFFVHLFACRCTTTTWKCLISLFVQDVNTQDNNFLFLFLSFDTVF